MKAVDTWHFDTHHIGRRVLVHEVTDSTNNRAAELAFDPANSGVVVLANSQTAGRGQYGRSWHSPPGSSVLMSVLLFPPLELRRPAVLTAWAAVAVAEAILRTTGLEARIKWPNDLLLQGKKICGILTECSQCGVRNAECGVENPQFYAVTGIGLNVNQSAADFKRMGLSTGTSLAVEVGRQFDVSAILGELISDLDAEYTRLMNGDYATLEACWKRSIGLLGKQVVAECADGTQVAGRLREMAFAGLELVQPGGSLHTLQPEIVRQIYEAVGSRQ